MNALEPHMSTPFPKSFHWGTATSSHQVEGDNQNNDWWDWESDPAHVFDHTRSGRALEWWSGRAEQDLRTARDLGQNAHRLSLEWSRIEPEPGRLDDTAFARYTEILRAARACGLSLLVTLNHFTLPRWLAARGGWLASDAPECFARYACAAVGRLGQHVELWATLNEPNVLAYLGYAGARWPPGFGDAKAGARAYAAQLRAHAFAYRALRRQSPSARVGLVLSLPAFDPVRPGFRDRAPTWASDWGFAGAALHALQTGWLLPPLWPARVPELRNACDWLGINYYGRYTVELDWRSRELFAARPSVGHVRTEWTDWGEPAPNGLTLRLLQLGKLGMPLYVTENGIRDGEDRLRPEFLRDHVAAIARALRAGADVRGYYHWSLIDNFEWAEGWSSHFGLIALDRTTGIRTPRPSAQTYARLCATHGAEIRL